MIQFEKTQFEGVTLIRPKHFSDSRGSFIKPLALSSFQENGLACNIVESFYSISKKDVFRGLHFQSPPFEQKKIVYLSSGRIIDIIVDIRKQSPTFGKHLEIPLQAHQGGLFIDVGFAHGFYSLENNTTVHYAVTSEYNPDYDHGIHFNSVSLSFDFTNAIVSGKDQNLQSLIDFQSPF